MAPDTSSPLYFSIHGDRQRRLVKENTLENRANWFIAFSANDEQILRRSIPVVPDLPAEPTPRRIVERLFPTKIVLLGLLALALAILGILGNGFEAVLYLDVLVFAATIVVLVRRRRVTPFDFPWEASDWMWAVLALAGLMGGFAAPFFEEVTQKLLVGGQLVTSAGLLVAALHGYLQHKQEVELNNSRSQTETDAYDRAVHARNIALNKKASIEREIENMAIPCLHYDEMVRIRGELFEQALSRAFAELGVSPETQEQVLSERDRLILESAGPTFGAGSFRSNYDRPVIEFPFDLRMARRTDSPVLSRYLSHLYTVKIALVLPQGFGTYDAIADSVQMTITTRGHELLLWKSISRVVRANAEDDQSSDMISVQSYGGSETLIPVNGFLIREQLETIPVVPIAADEGGSEDPATTRVVNSFVLAVQGKMIENN